MLIVAYLAKLNTAGEAAVPKLSVVVAKEDIPAGKKITDSMVELREVPQAAVAADVRTAKDQVVGQTARYPMAKGEPISSARLVEPPKVPAVSFQIPSGLRGFTVPVSVQKSPAALLAPGDFVDVIMNVELKTIDVTPPAQSGNRNADENFHGAVTLIQNAQVLSVQRQYVEGVVSYDPSVRGTPPKESNINL